MKVIGFLVGAAVLDCLVFCFDTSGMDSSDAAEARIWLLLGYPVILIFLLFMKAPYDLVCAYFEELRDARRARRRKREAAS